MGRRALICWIERRASWLVSYEYIKFVCVSQVFAFLAFNGNMEHGVEWFKTLKLVTYIVNFLIIYK